MPVDRRLVMTAPFLAALPRAAWAADAIGTAVQANGGVTLTRSGTEAALRPADPLYEGDLVLTAAGATAGLELFTRTFLNLGPQTRIVLDRFTGEIGGSITLDGAMVFDRPEDRAPIDLQVMSAFARIGVRGTRFFAGPSRGVFGIFVQRGRVDVAAGASTVTLGPGEGVDIATPGATAGQVARWGAPRIAEAFGLVGLSP